MKEKKMILILFKNHLRKCKDLIIYYKLKAKIEKKLNKQYTICLEMLLVELNLKWNQKEIIGME